MLSIGAFAQHPSSSTDTDCFIGIPNAFTPNDDGINDFFFLKFKSDCSPVSYRIQIMDRFGRLVFESKDSQEQWNGQFNGQNVQEGAYFWVLRTKFHQSVNDEYKTVEKKGTLLLYR